MRIEGARKLSRQLKDLPAAQRRHLADMLDKSGAEGVRVARVLVPRAKGDLARTIAYALATDGMSVEISAGGDEKRRRIQANTVEGGRDPATRGGFMAAQPFIGPTRSYLAKKHKNRVKRAINKAAKEVTRGG